MKGVSDKELNIIKNILSPYRNKYEFFAYGSRVKGNFRILSDLDLMIKSEKSISLNDLEMLKEDFNTSDLPFVVSLVDYSSLSSKFYDEIKDDLVKI